MNEFDSFVSQLQSPIPENQSAAIAYFEEMMQRSDFGHFMIDAINFSSSQNSVYISSNCFKKWLILHWESFVSEQKEQLVLVLIQFIFSKPHISPYFFDTLIYLSKTDKEFVSPFIIGIVPQLLQKLNIFESVLKEAFHFLSRIFLSYPEISFNHYCQFKQFFFSILTNSTYLSTNEGCEIIKYSIKCFYHILHNIANILMCNITENIPNDKEDLSILQDLFIPIEFSKDIISKSNNAILAAYCSSFIKSVFTESKICSLLVYYELLKAETNSISLMKDFFSNLLVSNIHRFIEYDFVIIQFLRTIHLFHSLKKEYFQILIETSKLTQHDLIDFEINPIVFYSSVYSHTLKQPRVFSLIVLDTLISDYPELLESILLQGINELSMRIVGTFLSLKKFNKSTIIIEHLMVFMQNAISMNPGCVLFEITSKLFLILNFIDFLKNYNFQDLFSWSNFNDTYLIQYVSSLFQIKHFVVQILLCKIVSKMTKFNDLILRAVVDIFPICPKKCAIKALNNIAVHQIELFKQYAQEVTRYVVDYVMQFREGDFGIHITLLGHIIKFINNINLIFDITQKLNMQIINIDIENECEYLIPEICQFDLQIIKEINNPQLSKEIYLQFLSCLKNSQNNSLFDSFEVVSNVLLCFISMNPQLFIETETSRFLIDLCFNLLEHPFLECILDICDIISYIIQVDTQNQEMITYYFNVIPMLVNFFVQSEQKFPLLQLGIANIFSSMICLRISQLIDKIPVDFLINIYHKNYLVRKYDKCLAATAYCILGMKNDVDVGCLSIDKESLMTIINDLLKQQNQQNNTSKFEWEMYLDNMNLPRSIIESNEDRDFGSPIEQKNLLSSFLTEN